MRNETWGVLLLVAAMWICGGTAPVTAADEVTVGDFVFRLARARGLEATDAPRAAEVLSGAGIVLPAGLNYTEPLTEGELVRIVRAAGLRLSTTSPERTVDATMVDRVFANFAVELAGDDPRFPGFGREGDDEGPPRGKGKGKGRRSPHEPD